MVSPFEEGEMRGKDGHLLSLLGGGRGGVDREGKTGLLIMVGIKVKVCYQVILKLYFYFFTNLLLFL